MAFRVFLTRDAERDLVELYDYIAEHDTPVKADHVLERIEQVLQQLAELPQRGTHPKELIALGIRDFREVFFKPYRILYRVVDDAVFVMLIVDGRRDMQTLLQRRLFEA